MFDNEMNWVTHQQGNLSAARRISRDPMLIAFNTRPSTCELAQAANSGKCSRKKSVFRRVETMRASAEVQSQRRRIGYLPSRTEVIRLPAWS